MKDKTFKGQTTCPFCARLTPTTVNFFKGGFIKYCHECDHVFPVAVGVELEPYKDRRVNMRRLQDKYQQVLDALLKRIQDW